LVLTAPVGNRHLVTAVNAAAGCEGIAPGMALADARAVRPDLAVAAADFSGDAMALARLAQWCDRYSPWVASDGADGIKLDVTGCAHLRGGEQELANEAVERLGRQGITARAAIADTLGAAWGLARYGGTPVSILPAGDARAALAALPVAALRLDAATATALVRLGLRRIGDLYPLSRPALVRRFGAMVAARLDQALGAVSEPLSPVPPLPVRWARRRFAEPIATLDAVVAGTRTLIEALCRRLAGEALGVRRLELSLYRIDGRIDRRAIGTARPSREPRHLLRLLEERLDDLDLDPVLGIEDMALVARRVEPLAPAQLGLAASIRGEEREIALAALLDRLANRLGADALGRPVPRESHVPERAVRLAPALTKAATAWDLERQRPVRLLPRPEPIEATALVPDDPPVLFRWRRVAHRVRRADGPERIAEEWWHERAEPRDYYRVEDEAGRRFWLYRAGLYRPQVLPRWFLHGIFA
jgi:protein ImuB